MKLTPVSEQPNYFKILVYGPPDSGKTTFSASGAKHKEFGTTAIMNIERGLQSVRRSGAVQTPDIKCEADIEKVITCISSKAKGWEKVKTLVVDSATEMQRVLLEEAVRNRLKKKPDSGSKPQLADYGDLTAATRRLGAMLRDLPCHIIITALEKTHRDKEDGPPTEISPEMTAKACGSVMAMMDNVWGMKKLQARQAVKASDGVDGVKAVPERVVMMTRPRGVAVAKTRNAEFRTALPPVITNPTLPQIYDIFQESLKQ